MRAATAFARPADHAQHLPERRQTMQAQADYLDALRAGPNVMAFKRKA